MDLRTTTRPPLQLNGGRRLAGFALMGGSLALVSLLSLFHAVVRLFG